MSASHIVWLPDEIKLLILSKEQNEQSAATLKIFKHAIFRLSQIAV